METSGTVVMLMQCAPQEFHSLLSAREEKRGPSIVNMVPFSWQDIPSSLAQLYKICNKRDILVNKVIFFLTEIFLYKLISI